MSCPLIATLRLRDRFPGNLNYGIAQQSEPHFLICNAETMTVPSPQGYAAG